MELVADADVFVENMGRGAAERLGVGYDDLAAVNPGLVYLSIKGFQEGPYGDRPGMDVVAEAMSGLMSVTGEKGRQPVRVGTSIADMGGALYGVMGVLMALRERDETGEGQRVDGTLFEASTHWMSYWMTYADLLGEDPEPLGASHPVGASTTSSRRTAAGCSSASPPNATGRRSVAPPTWRSCSPTSASTRRKSDANARKN